MTGVEGRRVYAKSPLTHAMIMVRFDPISDLDFEALGKSVDEAFKAVFPHEHEDVVIKRDPESAEAPVSVTIRATDGRTFAQADRDSCAALRLAPYECWEKFFPAFEVLWTCFCKHTGVPSLKHIGMRYINQIALPDDSIPLSDVLTAFPAYPSIDGMRFDSALSGIQFLDDEFELEVSSNEEHDNDGNRRVILGIDVDATDNTVEPSNSDLFAMIYRMHLTIDKAFEACITERTRETFE
jgi:uncharacterized protein (TIGR04255 family)